MSWLSSRSCVYFFLGFLFIYIQCSSPHTHTSLALNPSSFSLILAAFGFSSTLADARPRPSFHSIRLGASMRTRHPRRTNRSRQHLVQCIASSCLELRYSLITTHTQLELPRRGLQRHVIRPDTRCTLYITTSLHYPVRLMGKTCCSSRPAESKRVFYKATGEPIDALIWGQISWLPTCRDNYALLQLRHRSQPTNISACPLGACAL